MDGECEMWT